LTISTRLHGVTLHTVKYFRVTIVTTYTSRWPYVDGVLYYVKTIQSKQLNLIQDESSTANPRDDYYYYYYYYHHHHHHHHHRHHHHHHYHSASLKAGSQPLPKRVLQTAQRTVSSLNSEVSPCFVNVIQEHITSSSSFSCHFSFSLYSPIKNAF